VSRVPELSVVVPLFNEVGVAAELLARCREAASATSADVELVFVDDASSDGTAEVLAAGASDQTRIIRLNINSGQFRATQAGLRAARGAWVCTLDGDLQDPPEVLTRLWEARRPDGEGVWAVKEGRDDPAWFVVAQAIFHALQAGLARSSPPRNAGSYVLMRRTWAERAAAVPLRQANLAAVLGALGLGGPTVGYVKNERYDGRSRVGARRLVGEAVGSLLLTGALERGLWLLCVVCAAASLLCWPCAIAAVAAACGAWIARRRAAEALGSGRRAT